jgi:replicative DNA helicase
LENQDNKTPKSFNPRVPPHSIEAEESVLGAALLDNEAINTAIERLIPEDFYRSANKVIFQAMCALMDNREPIDVITLSEQLRRMGALEQCGGLDNLSRLGTLVPSAAHIGYYAKVVKDMAMRRTAVHEASQIINHAMQIDGDINDFLDGMEQQILSVSDRRVQNSFYRVSDIVQTSIKTIEEMYDRKELVTGTPTSFIELDKMTAGFQPSDLIIIAARPSMGKTALALSIAQWVGIHQQMPVAVFSLEMSKEQLVLRMLCSEARVASGRVRTGHLIERDFPKLVEAASHIAEAPIYIDDTPGITVREMRAKTRRLSRENKLGLVVVDYLQLMRSPNYSNSREQEIADISRSLKGLAKELGVPVVALSQLNRSVESRTDKRPVMSDLRESGAIEQDADIIMFIYRDEVYNPDSPDKGVAELIISKQRSGPIGTVRVAFSPDFTRFDNLEERASEVEIQDISTLENQADIFIPPSDDSELF